MPYTTEERNAIATTILAQLGGNQFCMMTGVKSVLSLEAGIRFKVPNARDGIKIVKIILTADDLYTVTFMNVKGVALDVVEGVYNDSLRGVFERKTGLRTSMTKVFA